MNFKQRKQRVWRKSQEKLDLVVVAIPISDSARMIKRLALLSQKHLGKSRRGVLLGFLSSVR